MPSEVDLRLPASRWAILRSGDPRDAGDLVLMAKIAISVGRGGHILRLSAVIIVAVATAWVCAIRLFPKPFPQSFSFRAVLRPAVPRVVR
jgi:hypothetical protein